MPSTTSFSKNKNKKLPFKVIFWTALLAGTLDITAALLNSYIRNGTSPIIIFQFIASGVLGNQAFDGGLPIALLGLFFHYCIAFTWTFLFFLLYPKINLSPDYKIAAGLVYGIIVWLIMNLIILPLSNVPPVPFNFIQMILGISFLMLFIGLPISIVYHQYYKGSLE